MLVTQLHTSFLALLPPVTPCPLHSGTTVPISDSLSSFLGNGLDSRDRSYRAMVNGTIGSVLFMTVKLIDVCCFCDRSLNDNFDEIYVETGSQENIRCRLFYRQLLLLTWWKHAKFEVPNIFHTTYV